MDSAWVPVYTASIAGAFAVLTSLVTVWGLYLTHKFTQERETRSERLKRQQRRQDELDTALSKFRNPIMLAARELESRLNNILYKNFGVFYAHGTPEDKVYAVENTVFLFAQFFAWQELLHQEVQFLDAGTLENPCSLHASFDEIRRAFSSYYNANVDSRLFRLFGGEQRACGEGLIVDLGATHRLGFGCMGYAQFLAKRDNPDPWLASIRTSFQRFASDESSGESVRARKRLLQIQNALQKLMDSLDPSCAYHERARRQISALEL